MATDLFDVSDEMLDVIVGGDGTNGNLTGGQ